MDDPRVLLLSFDDRWFFMALKQLKCQGQLDLIDDPEQLRRGVAARLGVQVRELDEIARRLSEVRLIDRETLQPLNWTEDQAPYKPDPTATERKRRQRSRERSDQAQHHAGVTNGSRVTVTESTTLDKDSDEDSEKNSEETTTTHQLDTTFLGAFDLNVVVKILDDFGLKGEQRQDVADELVGASRKGTIKTSWPGWLRSTAANARGADFKLNHGLAVREERERRSRKEAETRRRRDAERESAARWADPVRRTATERRMAEARASIEQIGTSAPDERVSAVAVDLAGCVARGKKS
jgi:hypothetical protein